jgi:hypothetical protein
VISLPVWIEDWAHECCGQPRRLGDPVELELTFDGDVRAAGDAPGGIELLDAGQVSIVGTAIGPVTDEANQAGGTLIASGPVRFAIHGDPPADRVRCTGRLWETRHGGPTGITTGELAGIRWRPAIIRHLSPEAGEIAGYLPGDELTSTEDWQEHRDDENADSWAFELTVSVGGDAARA